MALVVIPHPFGGLSEEAIRAKADAGYDKMVAIARKWQPAQNTEVKERPYYPAPTFKRSGTEEEISDLYYERKWTDGLPIVAPSKERVQAMLKGTSLPPDTVLGYVPPRQGILTVELAATYAVMAGAKPEYMPVIIAAVQALLDPKHDWQMATATTNPCSTLIVVNGPIVKELGIQYAEGAFGPGPKARPNATISRAVNMMTDVVGGSLPPVDKSTIGYPMSYAGFLVGENEDANPWEPLNVQLGMKKGTNSVTVLQVRAISNFNMSKPTTGEPLLYAFARTMSAVTGIAEQGVDCTDDAPKLMMIGPEHAKIIADDGWTLPEIKKYLFEGSRIDKATFLVRNNFVAPICQEKSPLLSLVPKAEQILVMVAGGAGKHSLYMDTSKYPAVCKEIIK